MIDRLTNCAAQRDSKGREESGARSHLTADNEYAILDVASEAVRFVPLIVIVCPTLAAAAGYATSPLFLYLFSSAHLFFSRLHRRRLRRRRRRRRGRRRPLLVSVSLFLLVSLLFRAARRWLLSVDRHRHNRQPASGSGSGSTSTSPRRFALLERNDESEKLLVT